MIPKKIHYIWFGKNEKPKDIKICMKTWKKNLPGYEFIEWSEDNFDVNSHPYVKAAYESKKWAYVSDYVRAKALYDHGGIYLDTDVLVLDDLNDLRSNKAFVGFENKDYPFTAVWGCESGHPLAKAVLDMYDKVQFQYDEKDEMKFVNTKTVSEILIDQFCCKVNNEYQVLKDDIAVYPDDVLCNPSPRSKTIHVFTGTWMNAKPSHKTKISRFLRVRLNTKYKAKIYSKFF